MFAMTISSKYENLALLNNDTLIGINKSCQFKSKFDDNHLGKIVEIYYQ
jgi:hypothetical protein